MARTIAVGVGYRRGTSEEEIVALVSRVLAAHEIDAASVMGVGTTALKRGDAAIHEAAAHFGVDVQFFDDDGLAGSVCEAAALALAGPGAQLIAAKVKADRVTCALAVTA